MNKSKTILVIGATGAQGGSVVKYLSGEYTVRCMVRSFDKAKPLFSQGCQIVYGDLNNVGSLVNAMTGCYGVFGVTNFWDPAVGYEVEIQQTKNIGLAALQAGVRHLVYSTLDENSDVPHFESKVQGENFIKSLVAESKDLFGDDQNKVGFNMTSLVTSFYYENFLTFFPPKLVDDTFVFSVAQNAQTRVPMYSVADTGKWVLEIFNNPDKYMNKDVAAVSEYISYPQLVETFKQVTGKNASFNEIPMDQFKTFPGTAEIAANLQFFNDIHNNLKIDRRVGATIPLLEPVSTFKDFVAKNFS